MEILLNDAGPALARSIKEEDLAKMETKEREITDGGDEPRFTVEDEGAGGIDAREHDDVLRYCEGGGVFE